MSRFSLAQTLPPELLSRIFGWLVEVDVSRKMGNLARSDVLIFGIPARCTTLLAASPVCRQWRSPAQRTLFRFLDVTQADTERLANVVAACPGLAGAVQAVYAGIDSEDQPPRFPIAKAQRCVSLCAHACRILAVCGNVKHLILRGFMRETQASLIGVLDSLKLESLGFGEDFWSSSWRAQLYDLSPNNVAALAQKPTLRSLELRCARSLKAYGAPFLPRWPLKPSSFVTTRALDTEHSGFAVRLLQQISETLIDLRIYTECLLPEEQAISVFGALQHLQRLEFMDNVAARGIATRNAWLASAIVRSPGLRDLSVDDAFDLRLFLQSASPVTHLLHRFHIFEP